MTVYTGIWKIFTNKLLRSNKILSILILLCLIITVLIILLINVQGCDCNSVGGSLLSQSTLHDQHELCLIIPFRDRFDELLIFLMHMKVFLERQNIVYHVYVVNQVIDQINFFFFFLTIIFVTWFSWNLVKVSTLRRKRFYFD